MLLSTVILKDMVNAWSDRQILRNKYPRYGDPRMPADRFLACIKTIGRVILYMQHMKNNLLDVRVYTTALKGAEELWERGEAGDSESVLQAECFAFAKKSLLDPRVMKSGLCCASIHGLGDSDVDTTAMLADFIHDFYMEGFNAAEVAPQGRKCYID
jgi:hypothetical protein